MIKKRADMHILMCKSFTIVFRNIKPLNEETGGKAHKVGHLLKQLRDVNSYIKVAVYSFITVAYISRNRSVSLFHIYLPGLSEQW